MECCRAGALTSERSRPYVRHHIRDRCLAMRGTFVIYGESTAPLARLAALAMRTTLLESGRNFLQSAECASLSILAHAGLVWFALGVTVGRQADPDRRARGQGVLSPPARPGGRSLAANRDHPVGQARRRPRGRNAPPRAGRGLAQPGTGAWRPGPAQPDRRPGSAAPGSAVPIHPGHRLQRARGGRDGGALRVERGTDLSP